MSPATPASKPLPTPPSPPFHTIPGVPNFRDIGTWPIQTTPPAFPPRCVRTGLIFRGADTTRIAPEGENALRSLGITTIFDLRSEPQIARAGGVVEIAGIERIWAPVFRERNDDGDGGEAAAEAAAKRRYEMYAGEGTDGIVAAFVEILKEGARVFRDVLTHVLVSVRTADAEASPPPAIFLHCTTGNNRTGVFVALLLLLLGVSPGDVAREYVLSEAGLAPSRHVNVERLLRKGAFAEWGAAEARRKCERMVGARVQSMEALVVEVGRVWGGAEGYFRDEVGLGDGEIGRLRKVLTGEVRSEHFV